MSNSQPKNAVTVELHGGPRDGDTLPVHVRTVEKTDPIVVRKPRACCYHHAEEAATDDHFYIPAEADAPGGRR